MHKICCPCCFGRSCLVPNQGYLSEAGASIVDERLGLNIVPKTKVSALSSPHGTLHNLLSFRMWQIVHLASEVFHYHANDRMKIRMRKFATEQWPDSIGKRVSQDLPLKVSPTYHVPYDTVIVSFICFDKAIHIFIHNNAMYL